MARHAVEPGDGPPFSFDKIEESIPARGGETAEAWRQNENRLKEFMGQRAALQAEMNRLTLSEAQERAITVLRSVVEVLRHTPLDARLQSHGWSQDLMAGLAEECDRIVGPIDSGCDPSEYAAMGLGSWIRDTLDPRTTDALKNAVYQADYYPTALAERT